MYKYVYIYIAASSAGRTRQEPRLNVNATLVPRYTARPRELHLFKQTHNTQRTAHPTNGYASLGNGGGNTQ
jgi:hypothetical protein